MPERIQGHNFMRIDTDTLRRINRSKYKTMSVEAAERGIRKLVSISLTRYQFTALVSFLVSIGAKEFKRSEVYKLTQAGQFLLAAEHFGNYIIGDDGKESKELIRRRDYERRLYTHPVIVTNTGRTDAG